MKLLNSAIFSLCACLVLSGIGWGTRAWLSSGAARAHPGVVYWLKLSGADDIFHSGWFIVVLLVIAFELLLWIVTDFRPSWLTAQPAALPEVRFQAQYSSQLTRKEFQEKLSSWIQPRMGRLGESGSMLLAQKGRLGPLFQWLAHFALLIIVLGATLSFFGSFQARLSVDEGARVAYAELLQGDAPRGWVQLQRGGKAVPGFYDTGFDVECMMSARPSLPESRLGFYRDGKLLSTFKLAPGAPASVEGLTLHQAGFSRASDLSASLVVTDRKSAVEREFPRLLATEGLDLEVFRFQVLEVRPATDLEGASVQIEYQEGTTPVQRFWVFTDYPEYDFAHRKSSLQNFTLQSVRGRYNTQVLVSRDPGLHFIWAGLMLLVLGLFGNLLFPLRRYWFVFVSPAGPSVGIIQMSAWSRSMFNSESHFKKLSEELARRVQRLGVIHEDS